MNQKISFIKVHSNNTGLIDLIANWYFDEFDIPIERTHQRLLNTSNDDVIFQLILVKNDEPIATGGLYKKVGLLNDHPKFAKLGPWVALLYTIKQKRNLGYGTKLLRKIEKLSKETGLSKIYLHTFTAERLYLKNNWEPIERAAYKGHRTLVMKKEINTN